MGRSGADGEGPGPDVGSRPDVRRIRPDVRRIRSDVGTRPDVRRIRPDVGTRPSSFALYLNTADRTNLSP